jgi:Holliday junction resolvase RusA-like endonuclease
MKFTIVLPPKGQMRARGRAFISNGKACAGNPHKDNRQLLEEEKLLALLYDQRPEKPIEEAISLGIKAFLPIPKKTKRFQAAALAGEVRPTTKPDLDNMIKHFKDVCKGVFWVDDKQIVEYLPGTGKYYGDPARWEIEIIPWKS